MTSYTRYCAFWLKPISIFGLFVVTAFIKGSHMLAISSTLAPLRLMLADTPSPPGLGASLSAVGTLSGEHSTARYLAALPHRVLLVKQQVLSVILARQSSKRLSRRTT